MVQAAKITSFGKVVHSSVCYLKELGHILPGKNIHIHMYGKEFPRSFTKNEVTMDNVKVMYYHQYYRKSHHTDGKEGLPDFVIGKNMILS